MKPLRDVSLPAGLLLLALLARAAEPAPVTVTLDIDPQPIGDALNEFAQQSGLQIVFYSKISEGLTAPRLAGTFTPQTALDKLLANTGLAYESVNARTIAVAVKQETTGHKDKASARTQPRARPSRLAQARPGEAATTQTTRRDQTTNARNDEEEPRKEQVIEEVLVTGTHIREAGASAGTKVDVINRLDIDRSGLATLHEVVQTLPQNFGGGATEDTRLGEAARQNRGLGSTINLRGLGNEATLVLVNGRRIPIGGLNAGNSDVSNIPSTAIDRIEVLPDGASAVYGSDAIAGVVNIISRKGFEGAETRLRYGTATDGHLDEYQFGQLLGANWDTGSAFLSYEYYNRDRLAAAKRDFTASSDLRPFGGDDFRSNASNPGNILDPNTFDPAFAIPEGQDGTALTPDDLLPGVVNLHNINEGVDVLPDQERHSLFGSLSQDVSDRISLFAEGRYSQREFRRKQGGVTEFLFVPPTNAFYVDAFGDSSPYFVVYNFIDDLGPSANVGEVESYGGVLGGAVDFGRDWQVQIYGSYSGERTNSTFVNEISFSALDEALADTNPATAFNPFADGSNTNPETLERIRVGGSTRVTSELWTGSVVADGPLFDLPGGEAKLAIGADYREETFEILLFEEITVSDPDRLFEREVVAAFGELLIPLFGEGNRRPGFERLDVSLSARTEEYSDRRVREGGDTERPEESTSNPKVGVLWSPMDGLSLRASYGTSFRAPSLPQLGRPSIFFDVSLRDPTSPTGRTRSLIRQGVTPELKNETATTWTAGFDFAPAAIPNLQVDLTYFDIEFEDRITEPLNLFSVLEEEETFSSIIVRNPTQEQVDAICNSGDRSFASPAACTTPGFIQAIVDARTANTAVTKVDGVDFNLLYGFDAGGIGRFDIRLNGSYLFDFEDAFSERAPFVSRLGTVHNPVDFHMRNSITWTNPNGLTATAFLNYIDNYMDNASTPERKISSWTTIDLYLGYDTRDRLAGIGLDNTVFALNAQNVFDKDPPFVNNAQGVGYDSENAAPLGRFFAFNITKRW